MAINPRSEAVRKYADLAKAIAPGLTFNVLSWLGSSVSVFVDEDPFWAELARDPKPTEFLEKNIGRMPIGFFAEVDSGLKLAAFMAALRLFIAQSAPDLTQWDTLEYRELKYVKVSPTQKGRQSMDRAFADSAVYYTASGHGLLVTPNEALLKRFIDRRLARNGGPATAATTAPAATRPAQPWLGDSIAAHADRRLLEVLASTGHNTYAEMMQARAWGNLPILNEYRRLYPQQDPLAVHQKLWGSRLLCPGGGTYRWNEAWRTMESTVYGHPGEPKAGPSMPEVLKQFHRAAVGITFEPNGLRARAIVERVP